MASLEGGGGGMRHTSGLYLGGGQTWWENDSKLEKIVLELVMLIKVAVTNPLITKGLKREVQE